MPPDQSGTSDSSGAGSLDRAIALLQEALEAIDALDDATHLGARVQEILDELSDRRDLERKRT